MRHLAKHLENPQAKRTYIRLLTRSQSLPGVGESPQVVNEADSMPSSDMLVRSLLALDCLTNMLTEEHEAIQTDELKTESREHFIQLIDEVVRHLMSSRALLAHDRIRESVEPQREPGGR